MASLSAHIARRTTSRPCLLGFVCLVSVGVFVLHHFLFCYLALCDAGGMGAVFWPGATASSMYCFLNCAAHCFLDLTHLIPLGFSFMIAVVVLCHDCGVCALLTTAANVVCCVKFLLLPELAGALAAWEWSIQTLTWVVLLIMTS